MNNHAFGFNSSMVRLKVIEVGELAGLRKGFNSSMVRLKALEKPGVIGAFCVSIPLWCD